MSEPRNPDDTPKDDLVAPTVLVMDGNGLVVE